MTDHLGAVRAAYEEATGAWTGADWPHEYEDREGNARGPLCEGTSAGCTYCEAAAYDAAVAERDAGDALKAAERGDWRTAAQSAQSSTLIERSYGEPATWGPFRDAVEAAAEADGDAGD